MADDSPSAAAHASVLNNIISAIMHLVSVSPTGAPAATAALQAAHREITSWSPPIPQETPEALPPDPAEPITEADGDGPPSQPMSGEPMTAAPPSNDLADEPSLDTPTPQDPTQPPAG